MSDYRVNLEIFAGPLDLLLYLVRKEEVDIYDIPLAKITEEYVRYVEMLKQLDIDLAGDFLVMAATLMQIKSAMLLPREAGEGLTEEDLSDPRAELIRQLLEYKRFKDAANLLAAAADERGERFNRPDTIIEQLKPDAEPTVDLDQISVWDLLEAFDKIVEAIGGKFDISHIIDETPIDLYQIEILHRLQTEGPLSFERIFESRKSRLEFVGFFLAILEMIRDRLVWAEQGEQAGAIYLRALTDEPAEQAVRKAIMAAEEAEAAAVQQAEIAAPEQPQNAEDGGQRTEDRREQQQAIPIVEIPAEGPASPNGCAEASESKQSTEKVEPLEGEASRQDS